LLLFLEFTDVEDAGLKLPELFECSSVRPWVDHRDAVSDIAREGTEVLRGDPSLGDVRGQRLQDLMAIRVFEDIGAVIQHGSDFLEDGGQGCPEVGWKWRWS